MQNQTQDNDMLEFVEDFLQKNPVYKNDTNFKELHNRIISNNSYIQYKKMKAFQNRPLSHKILSAIPFTLAILACLAYIAFALNWAAQYQPIY